MSHGKLRKETNCLNCDAQVDGRYCKNCGQENIEPKQTFWGLITHFFNDVTHFDSKFWATLKPLIVKPGFLTEEYVKGRRMKYIDPVRMYLFISFAFFATFLSFKPERNYYTKETHPKRTQMIDSARNTKGQLFNGFSDLNIDGESVFYMYLDSVYRLGQKHYDSVQNSYHDSLKSSVWESYIEKKMIAIWQTYDKDPYNFFETVYEHFKQSISKIFFISLPVFSLFLYLLYVRRRKTHYYVSHAIFSLHCYSIAFVLLLLLMFATNKFYSIYDEFIPFVIGGIIIGFLVYLYKAMRNFYKQGWFKTLIKFMLLSTSTFVLIFLIALMLYLKSLFSMGVTY